MASREEETFVNAFVKVATSNFSITLETALNFLGEDYNKIID